MINSNIIRGLTDLMVLSLLEKQDMYGYEISKEVQNKCENNYELNEATLYAVLNRLESKQAIISYSGEVSFGRKRKYYQITTFGKEYYKELLLSYNYTKTVIDRFVEE